MVECVWFISWQKVSDIPECQRAQTISYSFLYKFLTCSYWFHNRNLISKDRFLFLQIIFLYYLPFWFGGLLLSVIWRDIANIPTVITSARFFGFHAVHSVNLHRFVYTSGSYYIYPLIQ